MSTSAEAVACSISSGMVDQARGLFGGTRPDVHKPTPAGSLHAGQHFFEQIQLAQTCRCQRIYLTLGFVEFGEVTLRQILRWADHDERGTVEFANLSYRSAGVML